MPTYDYTCDKCGHQEDLFLRITSNPAPRKCPACKRRTFKRQMTGGEIATGALALDHTYPRTDWTLPRQAAVGKVCKVKGMRFSKTGMPIIESRRQEREVMAGAFNGERFERE